MDLWWTLADRSCNNTFLTILENGQKHRKTQRHKRDTETEIFCRKDFLYLGNSHVESIVFRCYIGKTISIRSNGWGRLFWAESRKINILEEFSRRSANFHENRAYSTVMYSESWVRLPETVLQFLQAFHRGRLLCMAKDNKNWIPINTSFILLWFPLVQPTTRMHIKSL